MHRRCPLGLSAHAHGDRWVDGLHVDDAEVLAGYDHPHFGRWPAVTTRAHGEGRITSVGTVPGRDLARALARWLARAGERLARSARHRHGGDRHRPDGRRVHVVHNWSWQPARVQAPVELTDVLSGDAVPARGELELGAWDVRVLVTGPM